MRPKKQFGQHFLTDQTIAARIANALQDQGQLYDEVVEVGPGEGMLTAKLLERFGRKLHLVEIDDDLIPVLDNRFSQLKGQIHHIDFLEFPLGQLFKKPIGLIGNFPYNISSQILFKAVEHRDIVVEVVGMFQREVARRVVSPPGNKDYGLLSVWVQTFYEGEYLFTVQEGSFRPPPKVKSGVIRLRRKDMSLSDTLSRQLLQVIKAAFNQRRKTLRNALSAYSSRFHLLDEKLLGQRAEQLDWQTFLQITELLHSSPEG